jgi:hypothetical protein
VKAEIIVTVSGPVGCGKSAIAGEIEIALRAIGLPVRFADEAAAESERRMTHADWQKAIELYQPSVVIVEQVSAQRRFLEQTTRGAHPSDDPGDSK